MGVQGDIHFMLILFHFPPFCQERAAARRRPFVTSRFVFRLECAKMLFSLVE